VPGAASRRSALGNASLAPGRAPPARHALGGGGPPPPPFDSAEMVRRRWTTWGT